MKLSSHSKSIENRPEDWVKLEETYDEGGKYRLAYLQAKANGEYDHDDNTKN